MIGAPSVLLTADQESLEEETIERLASLLTACWVMFDDIFSRIPPEARQVKPRRGRSPDAMRRHLLEADLMHLSAFGPAFKQPEPVRLVEQEAAVREQIIRPQEKDSYPVYKQR